MPCTQETQACDFENAQRVSRAKWCCPNCGRDFSLEYVFWAEAAHPEWFEEEHRTEEDRPLGGNMRYGEILAALLGLVLRDKTMREGEDSMSDDAKHYQATPAAVLNDLLERYWNAAHAEGKEGRDHDTEDGVAQQTLSAIQAEVRRLILAEREACAKVCDDADKSTHPSDLADRIRMHSNNQGEPGATKDD